MAVSEDHRTDTARDRDLVLRLRDVQFSYHIAAASSRSKRAGGGSGDSQPTGHTGASDSDNDTSNGSLVGGLLKWVGRRHLEVRALDGIDLDFHTGDRIGIMGPNGAGKSTLLRVMAGIYPPSSGEVHAWGTVSAILGQSHGMDIELTGYENIRVRGLFLGVPEEEIQARVEEIAEYSELGPYLDLPLRVYSAGMKMRLGFSISTCFKPDILLLDEWLTAGDKRFMEKATKRMQEFVDAARCVVIVSHHRALLERTCDVILKMDHGKVVEREVLTSAEDTNGGVATPSVEVAEKPPARYAGAPGG